MWILLLMIAILPFEMNPHLKISSSFLGIFPDFTVIKLFGLLGLVWAVFQWVGGAPVRLLESRQARAFLFYLCCVTLVGIANGAGLRQVARLIAIVSFLPIVLTAVRTERDLKLALKTAGLVMILLLPYGYRQMLRFGGRLGVGLYEPNYLALSLVLLCPLALVFSGHTTTPWKRWLWLGGFGALLVEVALTGSRGGLLGLLIVVLLLGVRLKRFRPALLGMVALFLGALVLVPNPLRDRLLASGFDPSLAAHSATAPVEVRVKMVKAGLRMIRESPLTGVGLGGFKPRAVQFGADKNKIAHNTYIELAAELGLPTLAAFMLTLYACLSSLQRSSRLAMQSGNVQLRDLALALQIGLFGYLVSAIFLSAEYENFFWLAIFLSICVERIVTDGQRQSESERVTPGEPVWAMAR